MRLMSSIAVLALSMMEGAARFLAPDLGRAPRYQRRAIPRRLPRGHRIGDPVLAAKYQAERRARKALEWVRQQKWRACLPRKVAANPHVPAEYIARMRAMFPDAMAHVEG